MWKDKSWMGKKDKKIVAITLVENKRFLDDDF